MSLGKYEYKRLGLQGEKKSISQTDEMKTNLLYGDEWPITYDMLNNAIKK
jgi:hypothetical protein